MLHPNVRAQRRTARREPAARLEEACGLAEAIELDIRFSEIVGVTRLSPATYFGSGAVERLKERIAEEDVGIVVVDTQLTPVQQQNL